MTEKKRKPKFWIEFNSFANFGATVEASLVLSPEYNITGITDMQHSKDSARVITLIFSRRKQRFGRRGYSLKQEWEQNPKGFQLSESEKENKEDEHPIQT